MPVDVGQWIAELRSRNLGEYAEKQARFVQKERASIAQGVMIDGLTAVFLLNGHSVTSKTGNDVVSRHRLTIEKKHSGQAIDHGALNNCPRFFNKARLFLCALA